MKVLISGYGAMSKKVEAILISEKIEYDIVDHQKIKINDIDDDFDVLIDFSNPINLEIILEYGKKTNTPLVIATTGYSQEQLDIIDEYAKYIPILQSYNMSLGIHILNKILAQTMQLIGNDVDIEIIEKHHNKKIDSPSGTAKLLYETVNSGREYILIYDRSKTLKSRKKNEIGMHSIRSGNVYGEHTVMFGIEDEILEIKHTVLSKDVFARGTIKAAFLIQNKKNGRYTLEDIFKID